MASLATSRWPRILAGVVVLVAGAVVAQVPSIGSSDNAGAAASVTTTTATASQTPASTPATTTSASPGASQPSAGTSSTEAFSVIAGQPQAVHFNDVAKEKGANTALIAELPLSLQVGKNFKGRLRITFLAEDDGTKEVLQQSLPALSARHAVVYTAGAALVSAGMIRVTPGEALILPLRLAIPHDALPSLANGLVRVTDVPDAPPPKPKPQPTPHVLDAVNVRVQGQPEEVRFAPSTVQLRVTRWVGPFHCCLGRSRAAVRILGRGAAALEAEGERKVRLSNARNGKVIGHLTFKDKPEAGPVDAELRVDQANLTGKYDGSLPLDPRGETSTDIPVSVEVQDAFWIPLVLLFAAAFGGGYAIKSLNQRARRETLRAGLKRPIEDYQGERHGVSGMYSLNEALGVDTAVFPSDDDCKERRSSGRVDSIYCKIGEAASDDDFAARAKDVEEVIAETERWRRVAAEFRQLRHSLRLAQRRLSVDDDRVLADSEDLLAEAGDDPGPGAATDVVIQHLHDQHRILARYAALRSAWKSLTDDQRAWVQGSSPTKAYLPIALRTTADDWASARARLADALVAVRHAAKKTGRPPEGWGVAPPTGELVEGISFLGGRAPRLPVVVVPGEGRESPPRVDRRPARDILARVKKWEWLIAIATTAVLGIAFLLPKYTASHTFGSWEDYLSLFTLGFLGATVAGGFAVNWSLFPQFRSHSPAEAGGELESDPAPSPSPQAARQTGPSNSDSH
jgi:hypothetical protein